MTIWTLKWGSYGAWGGALRKRRRKRGWRWGCDECGKERRGEERRGEVSDWIELDGTGLESLILSIMS